MDIIMEKLLQFKKNPVVFETIRINKKGDVIETISGEAVEYTEILPDGVQLKLVKIPAGMYNMGSSPRRGLSDETPRHHVSVKSFYMSKYPVTQEQWRAVMKWYPPFRGKGEKHPADRVSWKDAKKFCKVLSKYTHRLYRLPSESEWEYSCRANTMTHFYFGDTLTTDYANYVGLHTFAEEKKGVYRHGTTDVGKFPPNNFGLYDMHGNIWEWCEDTWHDDYTGSPTNEKVWEKGNNEYHVLRGGGWHDPPNLCRSASRLKGKASEGEDYYGFRVALSTFEEYTPEKKGFIESIRSLMFGLPIIKLYL
jgi:formylglycine-generating enzyme required for sulfatase activity